MTFPILQRGKEYLKAALTLLRAAQTMTDRAIATMRVTGQRCRAAKTLL
jgi:hypothetical protein